MRVGLGYDVHRLVEGRDLILAGVKIPYEKGLLGHSDADVVLHALTDAILQQLLEISEDIFRIRMNAIREFRPSCFWKRPMLWCRRKAIFWEMQTFASFWKDRKSRIIFRRWKNVSPRHFIVKEDRFP